MKSTNTNTELEIINYLQNKDDKSLFWNIFNSCHIATYGIILEDGVLKNIDERGNIWSPSRRKPNIEMAIKSIEKKKREEKIYNKLVDLIALKENKSVFFRTDYTFDIEGVLLDNDGRLKKINDSGTIFDPDKTLHQPDIIKGLKALGIEVKDGVIVE